MTDRPAADAPAAPPAPRRLLGVRVAAWVEIALFFVAVLAIDALLLDGDRFWDVRPHPFWLIVILVAVQYGANASLVAALTASLALTVGNLPVPELGTNVAVPGLPFRNGSWGEADTAPAPTAGRDTDEVLAALGLADDEIAALRASRVVG